MNIYSPEEIYRFAQNKNIDHLRIALDDKYIYTNWYISEDGDTALHWIGISGLSDIAEIMINKGIDINKKTKLNATALHWACNSLNKNTDKFVSLLLSKEGININCKENIYGRTALHFATERNHIKIVKLLSEISEIDIDNMNNNHLTALHIASLNGYYECVEILLNNGANINCKEKYYNRTALHFAVSRGHVKIVKLLLDRFAEIGKIDRYEPISQDCKKLILDEVENRYKKVEFDSFISNYIEYKQYINNIYNICYPIGGNLQVTKPLVGWSKAESIRNKYYFDEIFFYLHMHIANLYSNKIIGSTIINSSIKNSSSYNAKNSDKTSILMMLLTDSLKLLLQPTYENKKRSIIVETKKNTCLIC